MRSGARSVPYYRNELGDPLWPPNTAGRAESSTEEDSTPSHDRGSHQQWAKPNVVLLAELIKGQRALFYVRLVGC